MSSLFNISPKCSTHLCSLSRISVLLALPVCLSSLLLVSAIPWLLSCLCRFPCFYHSQRPWLLQSSTLYFQFCLFPFLDLFPCFVSYPWFALLYGPMDNFFCQHLCTLPKSNHALPPDLLCFLELQTCSSPQCYISS